ncbi:hypothetical protein B0O40_2751 [Ruminococcaceae bacterium R-25]|jgi:hypothetical protein|nr:hypothetical protein B0O40_2751 [Ruminococcaceae bacterium R-25]SUQ22597.1 hypothetical protein SAMN06297423_2751 [Oscillospiraceae bacterium]
MHEIKCPKCGEVFQVDESGYAELLSQVRNEAFEEELHKRAKELEDKNKSDLKMAQMQQEKSFAETISDKDKEIANKDMEIQKLKNQLAMGDSEKKLAITEAVRDKDKEIADINASVIELKSKLANQKTESELKEKNLEERYKNELKLKDEQIEQYKDFKARQSTKMVGESLEQHCQIQFNSLRMTAFPNAYFEKDNTVSGTGSKGDFIFRDFDEGQEFISIMFEMKNEMDTTASKHKNEDFFKELDKDRNEKGCEYAVLVSLLEADNDLYNNGIVDVSYKYPKMYVIRPQFFIPMITLLRNAALNSLQYQKELAIVRNQQLDLVNFEANMQAFKDAFGRNYKLANDKFGAAIDEIDKAIKALEKTKADLLASEKYLRIAGDKTDDLSIKKLTKNAPSVKKMFDDLNNGEAVFGDGAE